MLSEFINGCSLTANQVEFTDLIIDHLIARGAMESRRLYESSFTDLDDQGVSDFFLAVDVKQIVLLLNDVKARAAA